MRGLVQVFDIINRGWLVPFIWVTQYYWLWATDSTLQICKFIVSAEANWLKAETPRGSEKKKKKSQFDMMTFGSWAFWVSHWATCICYDSAQMTWHSVFAKLHQGNNSPCINECHILSTSIIFFFFTISTWRWTDDSESVKLKRASQDYSFYSVQCFEPELAQPRIYTKFSYI